MKVEGTSELGAFIRARRKEQRLTQSQLAAVTGTSLRFISEVERGRATAGVGLVLHVLRRLAVDVLVEPREQRPAPARAELVRALSAPREQRKKPKKRR